VLESTSTLSLTSIWSEVSASTSLVGAEKVATIPASASAGFFRLRLP